MGERRVCVVSGSSSGIGAATVQRYAREGWDVVVNYSRSPEPAEAVAAACRALGAQALVVQADVSQDADARALAEATREHFGRADVLVNNAGTTKFVALKNLDGLDAEDFQRIYAVNVVGAFQLSRAFVPLTPASHSRPVRARRAKNVFRLQAPRARRGAGRCARRLHLRDQLRRLRLHGRLEHGLPVDRLPVERLKQQPAARLLYEHNERVLRHDVRGHGNHDDGPGNY